MTNGVAKLQQRGCSQTILQGKPILLETLAHDHFYKYDNPRYRKASKGAMPLDGSIVFLKQVDDEHDSEPAIYIDPEGHGVTAATQTRGRSPLRGVNCCRNAQDRRLIWQGISPNACEIPVLRGSAIKVSRPFSCSNPTAGSSD